MKFQIVDNKITAEEYLGYDPIADRDCDGISISDTDIDRVLATQKDDSKEQLLDLVDLDMSDSQSGEHTFDSQGWDTLFEAIQLFKKTGAKRLLIS